ncbi:MAG: sugar transferase [Chloroflexi bacterium]|nr:sugar transferase [Chloroflexota bacterium]
MTVVDPQGRVGVAQAPRPGPSERADGPSGGRRDWVLTVVHVATDAAMIVLAFFTSWAIRYVAEIGPEIEETNYVPFSVFAPVLLGLIPVSLLAIAFSGLYRQRRGTEWFDDIPSVTRSIALATMTLFAGVALLRYPATSRLTFILTWFTATLFVILGRAIVQLVASILHQRGIGVERVLIVGGNNLGRIIMQSLASRAHLGYYVVGFVDDDRAGDFGRFRHLGGLDDVERLAEEEKIDQVIVALPAASHAAILRIVDHCRQGQVSFKLVPDLYEMSLSRVDVDTVSGIPLIGLKDVAIIGWNALTKRAIDIVVASLALLALSPILAVIALLIKLESRGPVLYHHTRIGKNRLPFTMFKFRSMRQDADKLRAAMLKEQDGDNRLFKDRRDPRITRVGGVIRRWSLDELPQFWNVLIGDMSVVGPRPQIPPEVANYEDWHYKRLAVSPGLTGLWQVSGRSELTFDEMVIYDIYYIENWSLGLDFRILLRTVPAVLQGRGAF